MGDAEGKGCSVPLGLNQLASHEAIRVRSEMHLGETLVGPVKAHDCIRSVERGDLGSSTVPYDTLGLREVAI